MTDTRDEESLNARIARIAGYQYRSAPELGDSEVGWRHPDGSWAGTIPDYEHDAAFFVRIQVANGLCVRRESSGWWWIANDTGWRDGEPIGGGPDPIHAALDWLEKAARAGVVIKWDA